jgi:transposase
MAKTPRPLSVPTIPAAERTPTVELLLLIIEQQQATIGALEQRVDALEAEVRRLKGLPARPTIKPSALAKRRDNDDEHADDDPPPPPGVGASPKRPGSNKRRKRLKVNRSLIIAPQSLPDGSRLRGYQDFFVQDLSIEPFNTRYRLARYQTPSGEYLVGQLPAALNHAHFGPTLVSYIIHQHWSCPDSVDTRSYEGHANLRLSRQMPKTHFPYPAEFRQQMIELVRTGRSAGELSREFGCASQTIRIWVRQAQLDEGLRDDGSTTQENEEIKRLRRQVRQLEEERAILKKAAAWFAQETGAVPPRSSNS